MRIPRCRRLAALPWVLALVSCTSATRTTTGGWVPGQSVPPAATVLVLRTADAAQPGVGQVNGSGASITAAIVQSLSRRSYQVSISTSSDLRAGLHEAQAAGIAYVLHPVITEWEQHSTEWSARPCSAALSLELYDARSEKLVSIATHRVVGSNVQMAHPSTFDFVPELADRTVTRLIYGVTTP
jgi:hypothetical protein